MTHPTPKDVITWGIRQACADVGAEFSYHEPDVDQRLLHKIHDDADSIADYIVVLEPVDAVAHRNAAFRQAGIPLYISYDGVLRLYPHR